MDWQDIVLNYINNEMIKSCWRFNWHKISGGIMMALDSDYGYSAEVELTYRFKSRFGGKFIEFIECYKHYSKLKYTLYVKSERLFKKLRSIAFKIKGKK